MKIGAKGIAAAVIVLAILGFMKAVSAGSPTPANTSPSNLPYIPPTTVTPVSPGIKFVNPPIFVFSNQISDWSATFNKDENGLRIFVIKGRLAKDKTFDSLKIPFSGNSQIANTWQWSKSNYWPDFKEEKFILGFINVLGLMTPLKTDDSALVPVTCEGLGGADSAAGKGEMFQCTQQVGFSQGTMLDSTLMESLAYMYVVVLAAEPWWPANTTDYNQIQTRSMTVPLSVAALLTKGGMVDCCGPTCDVSDTTLDCDGDLVLNGADKCQGTEAGATVDADGCSDDQKECDSAVEDCDGDGILGSADLCPEVPGVSPDGCAPKTSVSEGGGCSLIR